MRVHKGCPICEGDVLGSAETGYYCKQCNLLFRKRHVSYKHMKQQARELIRRHFSGFDKDRGEVELGAEPKEMPDEKLSMSPAFQQLADDVEEQVETMRTLTPTVEESLEDDEPSISVHPEKWLPKTPVKKKAFPRKTAKKTVAKRKKTVKKKPAKKKKTVKKKTSKKKATKKSRKKTSSKSSKKKAPPKKTNSDPGGRGLENML